MLWNQITNKMYPICRPQSRNGVCIYFWCLNKSRMILTWGAGYAQCLLPDVFSPPFSTLFCVLLCLTSTDGISQVLPVCVQLEGVGRSLEDPPTLSIPCSPGKGPAPPWTPVRFLLPSSLQAQRHLLMGSLCCQLPGPSPSFVGSLSPAHTSVLSFLIQFCLVKLLSMDHLLPAKVLTNKVSMMNNIYYRSISNIFISVIKLFTNVLTGENSLIFFLHNFWVNEKIEIAKSRN